LPEGKVAEDRAETPAAEEARPERQIVVVAGNERIEVPSVLPVLPVRDVVIYPGVTVPLAVGRRRSLAALDESRPSAMRRSKIRSPRISTPSPASSA
jgi:hypothetical protein